VNAPLPTIVITSKSQTGLGGWRELWAARDLCGFLVWRDWKARYVQSVLGFGWAIVPPLFTVGIFTLVFGRLAGVPSNGSPYAVFSMIGVVLFTFFQNAAGDAASSLAANLGMASKVYFPRLVLPLAAVASKLIDLFITMVMLGITLLFARATPTLSAFIAMPAAVLIVMFTALGLGLWLAALSIQYRDVRFAQTYFLQVLMYVSPVIYSSAEVPAPWRWAYQLNPLAGAIEAARACLLGTADVPWRGLGVGALVAFALCASGVWCFRRAVRVLADVA